VTGAGGADAAGALRAELRSWLAGAFTPAVRAAVAAADPDEAWAARRDWNAALVDAGWGAVAWPARWGGRDAGVAEQVAYHEEMARAGAPGPVNAIGVANIAPAIMAHGSADQQSRHLRRMLRGDDIWSQGMSEPGAGSDLAALACRAVPDEGGDGGGWVVDGQKTWNSNGDRADWCQLFVRTDPGAGRHQGITCLLVDMWSPGIEVRPIRTMAGDAGFADVFLTGVRVPASAVLGEVGDGWRVATRTLSNERAGVAGLYLSLRAKLDRLLAAAGERGPDGRRPAESPVARDALAARWIDARVLEFLARRTLATAAADRAPGPEGSVIKLAWSQHEQALAATALDVLGVAALTGPWADGLLASRSLTIAGGTSEVNRNIVGERVLGLPR
jgi:alkylation response protein AidB-like acyl-CoA dehydrogenase